MDTRSYWIKSTPKTNYQKLEKNIETDIVIVGGGITGLTSAYLLKNLGYKVVVLESKRIILGATGNTTAKVTSQHGLIYKYLIDQFDRATAKIYGEAQEEAINLIEEIITKEKIKADFKRTNNYVFTSNEEELAIFKEEAFIAKELGLPATFTKEVPLPFKTHGAVTFSKQAQFHPRKYLLALAEKITDKNCAIYENSRVVEIQENQPCLVTTKDGFKIKAKKVVVATHFPILNEGLYFARLTPIRSYALGLYLKDKAIEGMYINNEENFISLRNQPTKEGKMIIFGGFLHRTGQISDTLKIYQQLENIAKEKLSVKNIDYHWSTQDNQTIDRIPYIGKYTPNSEHLFVATGFGGWGMTNGTVAAKLLSDIIANKFNPWKKVFDPTRSSQVNLESAKNLLSSNMEVAKHFFGDRWRTSFQQEAIDKLSKGEGKILEINNKKAAVYKDEKGKVYVLNPHCTHLGCILNFNNSEKSWDCPCHGSRFNFKGEVIQSPALKNLSFE